MRSSDALSARAAIFADVAVVAVVATSGANQSKSSSTRTRSCSMSHRVAATSLEAAAARMGDVLRDIAEGTRERFFCEKKRS